MGRHADKGLFNWFLLQPLLSDSRETVVSWKHSVRSRSGRAVLCVASWTAVAPLDRSTTATVLGSTRPSRVHDVSTTCPVLVSVLGSIRLVTLTTCLFRRLVVSTSSRHSTITAIVQSAGHGRSPSRDASSNRTSLSRRHLVFRPVAVRMWRILLPRRRPSDCYQELQPQDPGTKPRDSTFQDWQLCVACVSVQTFDVLWIIRIVLNVNCRAVSGRLSTGSVAICRVVVSPHWGSPLEAVRWWQSAVMCESTMRQSTGGSPLETVHMSVCAHTEAVHWRQSAGDSPLLCGSPHWGSPLVRVCPHWGSPLEAVRWWQSTVMESTLRQSTGDSPLLCVCPGWYCKSTSELASQQSV